MFPSNEFCSEECPLTTATLEYRGSRAKGQSADGEGGERNGSLLPLPSQTPILTFPNLPNPSPPDSDP